MTVVIEIQSNNGMFCTRIRDIVAAQLRHESSGDILTLVITPTNTINFDGPGIKQAYDKIVKAMEQEE